MQFKDNLLLIVPALIKSDIIKQIRSDNNLFDITFMSKDEFIKKVTFDYDNRAIYYVINKYNVKYEVAKIYLDNLYYVNDIKYDSDKLNMLVDLKKELIDNDLLIIDFNYRNYLNKKNICVYGFDYIDKYFSNVLSLFDNVDIISKKYNNYDINTLYEFDNINEEVEYVAIKICELINNNIDINNIKLVVSDEYNNYIDRIFKLYNIPISIFKSSIYSTYVGNYFINNISKDRDILINEINNIDNNITNKIVNILNKYTWCIDYSLIKDMLIYEFKNTYIDSKLDNSVSIINLKNNCITDDDYVFVMGFNQGSIPIIYKDEKFITDNLSKIIDIEDTLELNKIERNIVINNLRNIKNLTITYKLNSDTESCFISNLYEELNLNIVRESINNYQYSNKSNIIKLASKLNKLDKYNILSPDIDLLYSNYDIDYKSFDNKYKKINKDNLYEFINNKLLLSYSSLDNYNRCSFKYYLSNILKIDIYEDNFMICIGNIFHEVLEKMNNDDFNLDIEYENSINKLNREFNVKEKFFLNKLKSELKFIIDTIRKQIKLSLLSNALYEEIVYTNIPGNIKVTFTGKIDKLMYNKFDDKVVVAIIDYKTGNPNSNLNNVIYGLDMQLPIYLYLAKNTNKLENVSIAGFYLQKILNNEIKKDYKHSYLDLKEDNLKLVGYSNSDINILEKFDTTYEDSRIVKSLKTTSKGFYSYSKVIDNQKIDKLTEIIENKIKENADNILDCNFDINPKKQGNSVIGCEFCKFMDICFRKEEDILEIKEYKDLEFLEESE